MKTLRPITDERGIAFPMAMIVMTILVALMGAFAFLATSEPQIAANHMASVQARSLAESGLERAVWALTTGESNPGASGVLVLDAGYNLPSPMPAPYDGSTFVSVSSVGGFKVTVAEDTPPVMNVKVITAIGYVPNDTSPVAVKKIQAKVTRVKWINPVCGLCAGNETPPGGSTTVRIGGTANVNTTPTDQGSGGHYSPAGSYCPGVTPIAAVATTNGGTININGTPDLYSPGTGGSTLYSAAATKTGATFPPTMTLSDFDMAALKALAKSKGTYYQPTSPGGKITWTSPPPNGIIYVDTYSGNPFSSSSPSSDLSDPLVDIHGNWSSGWSGWLIVAGSLQVKGNILMSGLIYAQNDVTLNGTGNSGITGAVISTNRKDTLSSTIADTEDVGNAPITYDCPTVRSGGGQISQSWFLAPGTYQEIAGR